MATEYRITGKVDPSQVTAGTAKIKQDLKSVESQANSTKKAMADAFAGGAIEQSFSKLSSKIDSLQRSMAATAKSSDAVAQSNQTLVASINGLATASGSAQTGVAGVGKASKDAAAGQTSLDAAMRRVLQAVDAEAAEQMRLNALLSEAQTLYEKGAISADQFAKVQRLVEQGTKAATVSLAQQRAGYTQLGFQIQDITMQLALGINPLTVLAQQGGQTAAALSLALGDKGTAGKVATYLAGPWGSVIIASIAVLGRLGMAALDSGDAIAKAVEELKKDAAETEINRKAKEVFKHTIEGVDQASRDLRDALDKEAKSHQTSTQASFNAAQQNVNETATIYAKTKALLEQAKARLAISQADDSVQDDPTAKAGAIAFYQGRVSDLDKQIGDIDKKMKNQQKDLNEARVNLAIENGKIEGDAVASVNKKYDTLIERYRATATSARTATGVITQHVAALERQRQAEIKAAQDSKKTNNSAARAAERKAESERDFLQSIKDEAAAKGLSGDRATSLQSAIDAKVAEFKRKFNRAPTDGKGGEKQQIVSALSAADAREIQQSFDDAYNKPLQRLQQLQGKVGVDREIMNAKLNETLRLGRELTPSEASQIENSIRQSDALSRQQQILDSIMAPLQSYKAEIEALNALLQQGYINQEQYNARIADLKNKTMMQQIGGIQGVDPGTGKEYSQLSAESSENARYADQLAQLRSFKEEYIRMGIDYDALEQAATREHNEKLKQIEDASFQARLQGAQNTFDSLASIAEAGMGRASGVYKAMFAISKAFAIADSIVKIQQAIANALALPFPANLPAIAQVAAQAASIIANIKSVTLAFADGGYVSGPGGPRDDKINARLSDGEFVVRASAVAQPGNRALLEAMNNGALIARQSQSSQKAAQTGNQSVLGGDSYNISFGDVVVQSNANPSDGRQVGKDVQDALRGLVRDEIGRQKRPGGQLTSVRESVMAR